MEFRPLNVEEHKRLGKALRDNATRNIPLRMDPKTTRFLPFDSDEGDLEVETINAICSVPTHYSTGTFVTARAELCDVLGLPDGTRWEEALGRVKAMKLQLEKMSEFADFLAETFGPRGNSE